MNELIKVDAEKQTVSARELHERLNIGTRFNDWFSRMCEYGFSEGTDFYSFLSKTSEHGGRPSTDYDISLDMAKHICMIQRTPEGKECRQYLIDLEKAWNTPEQVMARALRLADKTISKLTATNKELEQKIEQDKPKTIFADAVSVSNTSILIGELAKILKQNGVDMGQNRLFEWLRNNGYLVRRKGTDYNMPMQKSMEIGLFEIKERTINNPDGSVRITKTVLVTGKGQQYFINKFLNEDERSA
jgi:anti-repressor protein